MNYNLANAAPYNNDSKNIENNSNIKNKNTTTNASKRNVTFKNRHDNIKPKIKKETIENLDVYQSEEEEVNDYLPNADNNVSLDQEQEQEQEQEQDSQQNVVQFKYKGPLQNNSDPPTKTKENFAKLDNTYASDYYKQFSQYKGSYQIPQSSHHNNSDLLKKLDNILYLLEEQQEEKTNLVTEELILYVFLGIFVIYVLDSFVKVGKYTR